jgi:hypothetical protein
VGRRALVLAVALLASAGVAPGAVSAADPVFQQATAAAAFGVSIDVQQRVTLPSGVRRVEAIVRAGADPLTFLATIPTPSAGAATLSYSYKTPSGTLYPNTSVELGFRLTFDDGRTVDGPTTRVLYSDGRFAWHTLQGKVVRVHWYEGDASFGRRALDIGERAIQEASTLLGVQESDPIDFFIYADRDAFYDVIGPGVQENVGGLAVAEIRTLFANIAPSTVSDPWVGIVVPHELTHLVFNTATRNPYHEPLHWLNEGLADYLAQGYGAGAKSNVRAAARSGDLMPLRALVAQFPSTPDKFSLAYDEAVSAIDYMVRTYGREALVKLIRSYADGVSDDAAFSAAIGVDTAAFEAGWLADLGFDAPKPYGPKPAPVGPLPPGWLAPGATQAPAASGPLATAGPSNPTGGDTTSTILVYLGIGLLGVLVVAGLVLVAARFSRGQPLLPPMSPAPAGPEAEPELATGEPPEPPTPPAPDPDEPRDPGAP